MLVCRRSRSTAIVSCTRRACHWRCEQCYELPRCAEEAKCAQPSIVAMNRCQIFTGKDQPIGRKKLLSPDSCVWSLPQCLRTKLNRCNSRRQTKRRSSSPFATPANVTPLPRKSRLFNRCEKCCGEWRLRPVQ